MEAKTIGGYDAYVYPSEPNDTVLKGCVILRGRWSSDERRHLVEWDYDGTCIFTDRFNQKYKDKKYTDWDLRLEDVNDRS